MRSVRARLRLYVPSDIDEEMREESTKLIEEAADRIEALETALKEAGEIWVRKDNRIEQLEAALREIANGSPVPIMTAQHAIDQSSPPKASST
jgi:hypothetical protein